MAQRSLAWSCAGGARLLDGARRRFLGRGLRLGRWRVRRRHRCGAHPRWVAAAARGTMGRRRSRAPRRHLFGLRDTARNDPAIPRGHGARAGLAVWCWEGTAWLRSRFESAAHAVLALVLVATLAQALRTSARVARQPPTAPRRTPRPPTRPACGWGRLDCSSRSSPRRCGTSEVSASCPRRRRSRTCSAARLVSLRRGSGWIRSPADAHSTPPHFPCRVVSGQLFDLYAARPGATVLAGPDQR